MASALYPSLKALLLTAGIDLENNANIKVELLTSAYTYSSAHAFRTSLTGEVGTPVALASKTITSGVFDAADTTLTAVTGSACNAISIFNDTGTGATSDLVAYIDGISVTPNGGNITIAWDNGSNRIFAL